MFFNSNSRDHRYSDIVCHVVVFFSLFQGPLLPPYPESTRLRQHRQQTAVRMCRVSLVEALCLVH